MKLLITLRDSTDRFSTFTLKYHIIENSLAEKWVELLIKNFFLKDHPIEKVFCLQGWQIDLYSDYGRSVSYLCQQINESILVINDNLHPKGYEYINLHFDVESMKNPRLSRDLLNQIHHHFELLIGQVWNPSKWYGLADDKTRNAIRNLNNICHEIEKNLDSIADPKAGCRIYVGLNGPDFSGNYFLEKNKQDLSLEDYECFKDRSDWGDCIIYYAQLGKKHIEAYHDKDDFINDENISGYKSVTGEFVLSFREQNPYPLEFFDWLKKRGYDPMDKTLGLGFPIVAKLENFSDKKQIEAELRKRNDLYSIELQDDLGHQLYVKHYPYTWVDQEIPIK